MDLDLASLFFGRSKSGLEKLPLLKRFDILGPTFRSQLFTKQFIVTSDARNIQAVFGSDADSFGNGPLRHFAFSPLVGNGVMTLDGAAHEKARAMIRPTFTKANLENVEAYDVHLNHFIKLVPRYGSTVDLQPLFEKLGLDSATEFIFGESVKSLTTDSMVDPDGFLGAFTRTQKGMAVRLRMPNFNFLHRDQGFWDSCRALRGFVAESVERALDRRAIRKGEAKTYILVDNLVKETQDMDVVQDALMNVFLPG